MTTWAVLVEQNQDFGLQRHVWSPRLLGHVDGTREQGMEVLRREALKYAPEFPTKNRRRRLYRHNDGFILLVNGATETFHYRFYLAELIHDSDK